MTQPNDYLAFDWFQRPLPDNIELSPCVFIESSNVFAAFHSELKPGLIMGEGSGAYDASLIATGPTASIEVGAYTCLNSVSLIADRAITIGAHCLLAWGTVVTDAPVPRPCHVGRHRHVIAEIASDPLRRQRPMTEPKPVHIADNVWIGFDSVITGGVGIGRGAIIGCKTLITEDIPPYAVGVGNPYRVVRLLEADDDDEARIRALREFGLAPAAQDKRQIGKFV
jgi:acetyltransferase-like isoleucine patch superfamily enzyme